MRAVPCGYEQALRQAGLRCHIPQPDERERLVHGIYHGVKEGIMALACSAVPERDALDLVDPAALRAPEPLHSRNLE